MFLVSMAGFTLCVTNTHIFTGVIAPLVSSQTIRVHCTHSLTHTAIFFVDFNISEIASLVADTQIYYCDLLQQTVINFVQNVAVILLR